jgi:3-oxoacyl-[acyl-carrier-protein] synthase II
MVEPRRVVVTGLGAITPLNKSTCVDEMVDEFWTGLLEGRSGVERIIDNSRVKLAGFPVNIAGTVKVDPGAIVSRGSTKPLIKGKECRKLDRFSQYALIASDAALSDAGLLGNSALDADRVGVILGTGVGGLTTTEAQKEKLARGEIRPERIYLFTIPMIMPNAAPGNVAIRHGFQGPNYSVNSACASATSAIYDAAEKIRYGRADIMVTGGTESTMTQLGFGGFANIKALSKNGGDPAQVSRPFDRDRDGFVLGEGAGVLILEEYEHARKRCANIHAEYLGGHANCDAHHITEPNQAVIEKAIAGALRDAGVPTDCVGYINAHGTSTRMNDSVETKAIMNVFGAHAFNGLRVSATKSMIGHSLGASGALGAIVAILSMEKGVVHPTLNYETPDPELIGPYGRHLNYVPDHSQEKRLDVAMVNSFGFGGHNAVLVFGRIQ